MTGLEFVAIGSMLVNAWQFYDRGEVGTERDQFQAIAKNCKLEEQDGRKRELRAAENRAASDRQLGEIFAKSEQHIRIADKGVSAPCRAELSGESLRILEEVRRRTGEIDQYRMRATGTHDD